MWKLIPILAIICIALLLFNPIADGKTLSGIAVAENGDPISGADITLLSSRQQTSTILGRGVSGSDGRFEFAYEESGPSISRGSLYLTATSDDLLGVELVRNVDAGQRVTCRPGETISGTVRDTSGRPLEGATVRPEFIICDVFLGQEYIDYARLEPAIGTTAVTSNAQGEFTVTGLVGGCNVCLHAEKDGFEPGLTNDGDPESVRIDPAWAVPGGTRDAEIVLGVEQPGSYGGQLKGRLIDRESGEPMPAVEIAAVNIERLETELRRTTITDADGRFEFRSLLPGEYSVMSVEPGRPVRPLEGIEITEEDIAEIVLFTTESVYVEGRVLDDETGKGIPGITVASPTAGAIFTDSDGSFSIPVLPGPGVLLVLSGDKGYAPLSHEIDAPDVGSVTGTELRLTRAASIQGKVLNSSGRPADGVLLRLVTDFGLYNTIQADSAGNYRIVMDTLPQEDSEYHLIAYDPVTKAGAVHPVTPEANTGTTLNMSLHPTAVFSGVLKDEAGKPVSEANITPLIQVGNHLIYSIHNRTISDESGNFTLEGLIPDLNYHVSISAEGYMPLSTGDRVLPELRSGETARGEFTLLPEAPASTPHP